MYVFRSSFIQILLLFIVLYFIMNLKIYITNCEKFYGGDEIEEY